MHEHETQQLCSVNRPILLNSWFLKCLKRLFVCDKIKYNSALIKCRPFLLFSGYHCIKIVSCLKSLMKKKLKSEESGIQCDHKKIMICEIKI